MSAERPAAREHGSVVTKPEKRSGAGRDLFHYLHPTDETKMWCGAPRNPGPIREPEPRTHKPTCVVCIDLRAMYGIEGWLALRDGRGDA